MFPPEHIERMHDPTYHQEQRLIQQCESSIYHSINYYLQRKGFPETLTKDDMLHLREQVRSQVSIMYSQLQGERLEEAVNRLLRQGLQRTHAMTTCRYEINQNEIIRRI